MFIDSIACCYRISTAVDSLQSTTQKETDSGLFSLVLWCLNYALCVCPPMYPDLHINLFIAKKVQVSVAAGQIRMKGWQICTFHTYQYISTVRALSHAGYVYKVTLTFSTCVTDPTQQPSSAPHGRCHS